MINLTTYDIAHDDPDNQYAQMEPLFGGEYVKLKDVRVEIGKLVMKFEQDLHRDFEEVLIAQLIKDLKQFSNYKG
jgi:hypothetical protein